MTSLDDCSFLLWHAKHEAIFIRYAQKRKLVFWFASTLTDVVERKRSHGPSRSVQRQTENDTDGGEVQGKCSIIITE